MARILNYFKYFSRSNTVLGPGAFGQVIQGSYQGGPVAIKMLKSNPSRNADYLRTLLGELKVMSYLGGHPNLVQLIGDITGGIKGRDSGEIYLIFECCSNWKACSWKTIILFSIFEPRPWKCPKIVWFC